MRWYVVNMSNLHKLYVTSEKSLVTDVCNLIYIFSGWNLLWIWHTGMCVPVTSVITTHKECVVFKFNVQFIIIWINFNVCLLKQTQKTLTLFQLVDEIKKGHCRPFIFYLNVSEAFCYFSLPIPFVLCRLLLIRFIRFTRIGVTFGLAPLSPGELRDEEIWKEGEKVWSYYCHIFPALNRKNKK